MDYIFGPVDYERRREPQLVIGINRHQQHGGSKQFCFELIEGDAEEEEECNLFSFNSPRQYLAKKSYPVKQQQVFSSPAHDDVFLPKATAVEASPVPKTTETVVQTKVNVPSIMRKNDCTVPSSSSSAIKIEFHDLVEIYTFVLNEDDDQLDVELLTTSHGTPKSCERISFENRSIISTAMTVQRRGTGLSEWSLVTVKTPALDQKVMMDTSSDVGLIRSPPLLWWMWDYRAFLSWTCQVAE